MRSRRAVNNSRRIQVHSHSGLPFLVVLGYSQLQPAPDATNDFGTARSSLGKKPPFPLLLNFLGRSVVARLWSEHFAMYGIFSGLCTKSFLHWFNDVTVFSDVVSTRLDPPTELGIWCSSSALFIFYFKLIIVFSRKHLLLGCMQYIIRKWTNVRSRHLKYFPIMTLCMLYRQIALGVNFFLLKCVAWPSNTISSSVAAE